MSRAVINNDDAVRRLLEEAGMERTAPLEASLLELRAAGNEAPAAGPSAELLAFMAPAAAATALPPAAGPAGSADNIVPFRRRRSVRGAVLGLAVAAATGLGATGVAAASPEFRAAAGTAVEQVVGFFDPADIREAVPAVDPATGGAVSPKEPVSGTAGEGSSTGTHADGGATGDAAAGDGNVPAGDSGRAASETRSGNAADPANVPGYAGNVAKDPGSVPGEAEEAAKQLLDDARETPPSDVVPSLPADGGLPAQGGTPGSGTDVPGLPADTPAVPER
jgi:hypothetical protein